MNHLHELYQQIIIDHSQAPHNFYTMEKPTFTQEGFNPLCGDQLTLFLRIEGPIIQQASFQGVGCAISIASASLMTDFIQDKSLDELDSSFKQFQQLTTTGTCSNPEQLGKLTVFAGVAQFPMRVKCATLAWHTLNNLVSKAHE